MNILAIETATTWCGVAHIVDGICEAIVEKDSPKKHAEVLPVYIKELQKKSDINVKSLDGIAISIGPGSFTGLRVGLSYGKGLAYTNNLPIIPVSTLMAMVHHTSVDGENFRAILYSHRDIVYHQIIQQNQSILSIQNEAEPVDWPSVMKWVHDSEVWIQWGCGHLSGADEKCISSRTSAASVGILANKNFDEWKINRPFDLVPNYISPFKIHIKN